MAFDMYLNNVKTSINHYEEGLFSRINEDERFPKLNWLWEKFYNSPKIIPEISNELVHELILLRSLEGANSFDLVIDRLMTFFSQAHTTNQVIETQSD